MGPPLRCGRDQGPGTVAFDDEGQLEQQLLGVVAPDDLEPDREAVELAGRDRDRRVAVEVGGEGELAVVARPRPRRRRTCPGSGPSAAKATSGLLAVITRSTPSTGSKMRAIASLTSIRRCSMRARASAEYLPAVAASPSRTSGVRSSAQAGQASPSSAAMAIMPLSDHAMPIRGSPVSRSSTRWRPASAMRSSAAAASSSHIAGETTAFPQSGTTATRSPASCVGAGCRDRAPSRRPAAG